MSIFPGHFEKNRHHKDMSFELFRNQIKTEVFDYQTIIDYFKGMKKPRDKVSSLLSQGKIIRIKKGLYIFGENWRKAPLCVEMIANLIYGPSCVSFEYALMQYGLLVDRATVVTSLAIGDTKIFSTPLGIFEYRAIPPEKFKVGIEYKSLGKEGGYFIACKEKALVDLVYRTPGIRTISQLRHYLFEEMRIEESLLQDLDFTILKKLSQAYKKKSITLLTKL